MNERNTMNQLSFTKMYNALMDKHLVGPDGWADGWSVQRVVAEYKCSSSTVLRAAHDLGLPKRIKIPLEPALSPAETLIFCKAKLEELQALIFGLEDEVEQLHADAVNEHHNSLRRHYAVVEMQNWAADNGFEPTKRLDPGYAKSLSDFQFTKALPE
jgi:hypothetical protein